MKKRRKTKTKNRNVKRKPIEKVEDKTDLQPIASDAKDNRVRPLGECLCFATAARGRQLRKQRIVDLSH